MTGLSYINAAEKPEIRNSKSEWPPPAPEGTGIDYV